MGRLQPSEVFPAGVDGIAGSGLWYVDVEHDGRTSSSDEEVEIVSTRATLRTPLPRRAAESFASSGGTATGARTVRGWSFTKNDWLDFAIVQRSSIGETPLPGPAIILEETATTYMDAEFEARLHPSGSIFITDTREA